MNRHDRANGQRGGPPRWQIIVGGGMVLLLLVMPAPPLTAENDPATMWTTRNDCGTIQQDVSHYAVGEMVYINGANFSPGIYAWEIMGQPGQASLDPGQIVASGGIAPTDLGSFCFGAYTVKLDDGGKYKVTFGSKSDSYQVDFPGVPTATGTPTATNTPTRTITAPSRTPTSTPTSTAARTTTPRRTATPTATSTWAPAGVISATPVTRVRTATPTPTISPPPSPTPLPTAAPSVTATPVVAGVGGVRTPTMPLPADLPNTGAPASGWSWLWLSVLLLVGLGLLARRPRRP